MNPPNNKPEKIAGGSVNLPLIPLRNTVVFPQMIAPLFIGREKSIKALEEALKQDKKIILVSQKKENIEEPKMADLAAIGTLAWISQYVQLPDGTIKVLVEGSSRVEIKKIIQEEPFCLAAAEIIGEPEGLSVEAEAEVRIVIKLFEKYVKLNRRIPPETIMSIINVDNSGRLADLVASYLTLKIEEKQAILEAIQIEDRLDKLAEILKKEIEIVQVERKLQNKVRMQTEKVQREYYLKEKLRAIQTELGEEEEEAHPEIADYKKRIAAAKMPPEAREKAEKELSRLQKMPPMVSEATVIRTYLDWLIELPWNKKTRSKINISEVEAALNQHHHGLKKVKERILEYFAVLQVTGKSAGSILCLVGPPGVGKTSIASSIARAMGRKFVRVSLGGIRDEAEIRGHRRTYVGSLPGRIIQSIHKIKYNNPVFLLDEIDKIGADFRGDPSSALLEALDPEQNRHFSDHYLEVPFDLSDVFFITTANTTTSIIPALRDRMEIIPMSGYTEEEKIKIASGYLIPKQLERHGLKPAQLFFDQKSLQSIVREYTREAGVRELERTIATILRKITVKVLKEKKPGKKKITISQKSLHQYLGAPRYHFGLAEERDQVGMATGMAWTETGGDTIPVEVTIMRGRGNLTLTGQLGTVMKESAKAAISYVRSRSKELGLEDSFYRKYDFHIHVPEGAVPKDGPSAGITIATALVSALTLRPVHKNVAMTGEITLRGKVLPIGGLKEKILAARRAGIKNVIFPNENKKDFDEIKSEVPKDIKVNPVKSMDEVLKIALLPLPSPTVPHIHPDSPENRMYA